MRIREVLRVVKMKEKLDTRIGPLREHDRNPFSFLPPDLAMISLWNLGLVLRNFVTSRSIFVIKDEVPSVCLFAAIDDVIHFYQTHLSPEYGGFLSMTRIDNDRSAELRKSLMAANKTAAQLALEYDRQHSNANVTLKSGDSALDEVVNDIMTRHGKGAAISYLLGLRSQLS